MARDPETREEWQAAADAARQALAIHAAVEFGIETDAALAADIDADRARWILDEAWKSHRVRPQLDRIERAIDDVPGEIEGCRA